MNYYKNGEPEPLSFCHDCKGSGQEIVDVARDGKLTTLRRCRTCNGKGKAAWSEVVKRYPGLPEIFTQDAHATNDDNVIWLTPEMFAKRRRRK